MGFIKIPDFDQPFMLVTLRITHIYYAENQHGRVLSNISAETLHNLVKKLYFLTYTTHFVVKCCSKIVIKTKVRFMPTQPNVLYCIFNEL